MLLFTTFVLTVVCGSFAYENEDHIYYSLVDDLITLPSGCQNGVAHPIREAIDSAKNEGILGIYSHTRCYTDYAEDCPDWCNSARVPDQRVIQLCLKSCRRYLGTNVNRCESGSIECRTSLDSIVSKADISDFQQRGHIGYPTFGCRDLRPDCGDLTLKGYCQFDPLGMAHCASTHSCGYCDKLEKYFPLKWERLNFFAWMFNFGDHNEVKPYRHRLMLLEQKITAARDCIQRMRHLSSYPH